MSQVAAARPAWSVRDGRRAADDQRGRYRLLRLASVAILLVIWELAGRRAAGSLTLPPVSQVLAALGAQLVDVRFWAAALVTFQALVVGFALIVIVGIPAGLAAGHIAAVGRVLNPYLQFLLAVPASPLVPLFVIAFGIGLAARVATVVVFGIAVLVVNTAAAARQAPVRLIDMARSFGASGGQIFLRVVLPASVPGIAAGLRLASARAVVGMIVSELIIISVGLGRMISTYSATFDIANLYAIVVVVLAVGVGVARTMIWLERRLVRWT
jgi:ABC-type nitrate/sulfonate/bicarbonate transport system permease component